MALVIESWAKITAIDDYEAVAGELLFRRIFEINPGATAFFTFAKDVTRTDHEAIYQSELFQVHATAVISTVDAAVGLLQSNSMDTLTSVLKGLGAKHASMSLEQAHFDLVGQALLDTLAKALGSDYFTQQVREAWAGVYEVIAKTMLEGANAKKKELEESPPAPRDITRDSKAEMIDAVDELKRITAEKVQTALLNYEKQALADQARIQAERDAELKRVAEFKAKFAAEQQKDKEAEALAATLKQAEVTPVVEQHTDDESDSDVQDVQNEEGAMVDDSDRHYNDVNCTKLVFGKLYALTSW